MWWVYFVLTGCLTFLTVTLWLWYIRWRSAEIRREEDELQIEGPRKRSNAR
jgi:hypothetical protein